MFRSRRACLVVPGNNRSKLEKAAGLEVDEVIIDLEDAVPADQKVDARRLAAEAVATLAWRAPTVAIRVNAIGSAWFADDVAAVAAIAGPRLSAVVVPKVESAATITAVIHALAAAGRDDGAIGIEAQIETALGVVRVDAIAEASPILEALIFGAGDFAASMDLPLAGIGAIDRTYPGDQWAYPRARIAVAAHAFGLEAIDSPYAAFRDLEGFLESSWRARAVGMTGKWVIHPGQVGPCLTAFSPTADEIAAADRTLAELDAAAAVGSGAAASGGAMIDEASRRQAERVRARARGAAG